MLIVFGDSHSAVWGARLPEGYPVASQFPLVEVHHLGAALAYNLMGENGVAGKWGNDIFSLLSDRTPTAVMLCFGEIDIRAHILKQASARKISLEAAAAGVVARYLNFVDLLRQKTPVPIFLWGPVPSARDFCDWDPSYPYVGSQLERNLASKVFIRKVFEQSKTRKDVYAFDIFDALTTGGLLTKESYFPDKRHLGIEGLALAIDAFKRAVKENNLNLPDYFDLSHFPDQIHPAPKDIAKAARIIQTSPLIDGGQPAGLDRPREGRGYIFHTSNETIPYIVVDLGYSALLHSLAVYNRFDGHKERAASLEVLVGDKPDALRSIYQHPGALFGMNDEPLMLKLEGAPPVRYLALRLREKEFFHLGKISIFANSFI